MYGRFPHLSAFAKKFLEVCGAGLASGVIALLIGQTDKPAAPLSAVVYLSPADEQMIKVMHDDQAALLQRLRALPEMQITPAAPAVGTLPETVVAAAPPKSTPTTASRREQKPNRPAVTAAKQRADAPPVQSIASKPPQVITLASHAVAASPETRDPLPAASAGDADWLATLKQIPAWFWPAGGGVWSEAPRPPLPIGNFPSRML